MRPKTEICMQPSNQQAFNSYRCLVEVENDKSSPVFTEYRRQSCLDLLGRVNVLPMVIVRHHVCSRAFQTCFDIGGSLLQDLLT